MNIGFSTGFLHREIGPISSRALEICREVSAKAIEINCIGGIDEKGDELILIKPQALLGFEHVSIHSPSKVRYGDDNSTCQLLAAIEHVCREIPIHVVVFHPDLVDCWEVLSEFKIPYAFENMDHRKEFGKSILDLKAVFLHCDAKFVLDLNHCYSMNSSMVTARELIEHFGDRLCEVHLSGFTAYHELLCETLQTEIMDALPEKDVPIILEGDCKSVIDVQREYDYVTAYLRGKKGLKK